MKKFIAIYHAPAEALKQSINATPEEKEAGMKLWFDWKEKNGNAVIELGAPLAGGLSIDSKGNLADSTKEVVGYSVVEGDSRETAQKLFEDHPHLNWHPKASVELHEVVNM